MSTRVDATTYNHEDAPERIDGASPPALPRPDLLTQVHRPDPERPRCRKQPLVVGGQRYFPSLFVQEQERALESGIGADVLGYIETTVPTERRYVAVYVLSHLVNLGHAPAEAQQTVEQALARGPDALANIATQAEETLARRGLSGAFAAASIPAFAGPPAGLPAPGSIPTGPPHGIPFGGPPGDGS